MRLDEISNGMTVEGRRDQGLSPLSLQHYGLEEKEGPAKKTEKQQPVKNKGDEESVGPLEPSEESSSWKRSSHCVKCY